MRTLITTLLLALTGSLAIAQSKPIIKDINKNIDKNIINKNVEKQIIKPQPAGVVLMQVPPSYAKTHFFIQNPHSSDIKVSLSKDQTNWKEITLEARSANDLLVTDSVYVRIFTTKEVFFIRKVFPTKYYKVEYNNAQKKWMIL